MGFNFSVFQLSDTHLLIFPSSCQVLNFLCTFVFPRPPQPPQPYPPDVETSVVRMLLEAGANVLAGNRQGLTAVHIAAQYGHSGALRLLLGKEPSGANVMAASRETPLHLAVKVCFAFNVTFLGMSFIV